MADSSADALLAVLPPALIDQLIQAHGVMQAANLVTQATQAAMAENQRDAVFTALPTIDLTTRMVASSPAITPALLNQFGDMQDTYLAQVREAVTMTNDTLVAQLHDALAAVRRNGGA
jgi:hypothetical protein